MGIYLPVFAYRKRIHFSTEAGTFTVSHRVITSAIVAKSYYQNHVTRIRIVNFIFYLFIRPNYINIYTNKS